MMQFTPDKKIWNYRGWRIISQQPKPRLSPHHQARSFLDELLDAAAKIEMATGYKWEVTAWIKQSPSHKYGISLDLSPLFTERGKRKYAAFNGSDPVLYKRIPLLRSLQRLAATRQPLHHDIGIFIEPDHLHVQLFAPTKGRRFSVIQWKQPKPLYADTLSRMQLPVTSRGY